MPSQIKVDEIKNVAGQYEIKTNTFKGQTTAGSIAVQGEGTATTNLQQGLAKVWINYQQTSTFVIHDSLNISSVTDGGAGLGDPVHTNNMSNGKYAIGMCCNQVNYNTSSDTTLSGSNSSSTHRTQAINTSNAGADASYISSSLHGDLA